MAEIEEEILEEEIPQETNKGKLNAMLKELIQDYDEGDEEGAAEKLMVFIQSGEDQRGKLANALKSDPRLAQVLSDIASGKSGAAASLARYYGKDFFSAEEGTKEYEDILAAEEQRKAEQDARELSNQEFQTNLQNSIPVVEEFCSSKGIDSNEFLDWVWDSMVKPVMEGNIGITLEPMFKAYSYDKDIADSMEAGTVRGRNENIAKMKVEDGDGLPKINGSEQIQQQTPNRKETLLDIATRYR